MVEKLARGARVQGAALVALVALVALGAAERLALVRAGGQLFWFDEVRRFQAGWDAAQLLGRGAVGAAARLVLETDCPLFVATVAGLGVAPASRGAEPLEGAAFVATVLALVSAAVPLLVHALARRLGAGRGEALAATALALLSLPLLQWARHVVPYDLGLALCLASLWLGLGAASARRAFAAALVAGAGLMVYDGGWVAALVAVALPLARDRSRPFARAAAGGVGLALPLLLLAAASHVLGATPLFRLLLARAGTVTLGQYSEGWTLALEYFARGDGVVSAALGAGLVAVVGRARRGAAPPRVRLWLAAVVFVYAALALASTAHVFVVYGRTARQLAPFACLAVATAVPSRARAPARLAVALLAGALVLAAGRQFATLLRMQFPNTVLRSVIARGEPVEFGCTVSHLLLPLEKRSVPGARWVLLNAQPLYLVRPPLPLPEGRVVFSARHPSEYPALQHESYDPEERRILRSGAASIRLIDRCGY